MTMLLTICLLTLGSATASNPQFSDSGNWLQYANAEEAGFSTAGLEEARAAAEAGPSAAFMAIYRGHVLVAWGEVDERYKCHSVRKSIYSALIGMYAAEGRLDLDKSLAELDIEDIHGLSEAEKQATMRDMIRARSGIYHPAAKEPMSMKEHRPERGSQPVGTHFFYNNWDFNTSVAILEQEAGVSFFEAFRERLAIPLGMQDFRPRDGFLEYDRSASRFPAHAFRLSARDLARFGQLYLQNGVWNGKQLIPESWIRESTKSHSSFGLRGYGYMWWVMEKGAFDWNPELSGYMARGTGGQLVLVCPEVEMVVVQRGDTDHNRHASFNDAADLLQKLLAARIGEPKRRPNLVEMEAIPLAGRLPALADRDPITLDPDTLTSFAGRYEMGQGLVGSVRALEDRLVMSHPRLGEIDVFPASRSDFFAWNANIQVHFSFDEQERPVAAVVDMYGRKISCTRVE